MPEVVGITFDIGSADNPLPVRDDPEGLDVVEIDDPYLLSDGKSLVAPIPAVLVSGDTYLNDGVLYESVAVNLQDDPDPSPGDLGLNDPQAVAQGTTVTSVSFDTGDFTANSTASRRAYSLPIPATGTRVEFDITVSVANLYFRTGLDTGLGPTGIIELVPMMVPGTYHVDILIPSYSTDTHRFGFLSSTIGTRYVVTNWRVTFP